MEKRGIREISLGNERIWSLAYADDMVVLANNKVALEDIMSTLRRFLNNRTLVLNTDKTKVMVFNKMGKKKKGV